MAILNNSNAISAGGYDVNNSLRFRSSANANLTRTPASNGNLRKWTYSAWVKRGLISNASQNPTLISCTLNASFNDSIYFIQSTDVLAWNVSNTLVALQTTQVFRDPSAWYHIVLVWDTDNATVANRARIYVNGSEITTFSTDNRASISARDSTFNRGSIVNYVGGSSNSVLNYDGYLAEVNFIDGQVLTPSSFGETNTTTGSWVAKKYTGTYGTNGFYLKFSDIATTSGSNAGLGKDFSGNTNYWTTNNISVTSGTTYDAMTDSPTNTSAIVGNYCTLNPLRNTASIQGTFSNANLRVSGTAGVTNCIAAGTMTVSGKMYWEITITTIATASTAGVGIVLESSNQITSAGSMTTGIYYLGNGNKRVTGTSSAYGSSYTSGDVIGIDVDTSAETITFYKNNVSQGSISGTGVISLGVLPFIGMDDINSPSITANFGQRPFAYTPPTGFVALNTFNLPDSTIKKGNNVMDATTYTGTGASLSVTNASAFKPDFVWIKGRSGATDHALYDSVRGTTIDLVSNSTAAETTQAQGLTTFGTNGFTVGTLAKMNTSAATYVAWQWQAGQGSTSSNTQGTITSTVSVNASAGFSVVTYTGTGANATVGHGLGVAPKMMIVKNRTVGRAWAIYHSNLTSADYTLAFDTGVQASFPTAWNSTAPTSLVFSVGANSRTNESTQSMVAYCWAEIASFSKFGSYTGNGSADGVFVYLGFRPKFIMFKRTDAVADWQIYDSSRSVYNVNTITLAANLSSAESAFTTAYDIDLLSNGIKWRATGNIGNASGGTYIYAAFAENPFKNANAR